MNAPRRNGHERVSRIRLAWGALRSLVNSVTQRWALAGFSLVAAFGVWFVIQDVENPRVEGSVPSASDPAAIRVGVRNAGNYIVSDPNPVRVRIDARKADLATLRPTDFEATADVKNVQPGSEVSVPVTVRSLRDGVRILEVQPERVTVTLQEAKVKDMPVTVNVVQNPPENYRLVSPAPTIDPLSVKVRGLPDLVDSVAAVVLDVNLSGARSDSVTLEGDLVARTEAGNPVTVTLSQSRARVTYQIEQTFVQRTLGLTPAITGAPAPGYRIGNVTIDPQTVIVTGPKAVVDSLQSISAEAINITGAKNDITQVRQVDKIPNLATDRQTVIVKVEIRPIDCGDAASAPCGAMTITVAPTFGPAPTGLVVDSTPYVVSVRVTGPLALLATATPVTVKASVVLTGGLAGPRLYDVVLTGPPGLKFETDALTVTLKAVVTP